MGENGVGQTIDPAQILVAEHDRRTTLVSRGHHQGQCAQPVEYLMVHRRVGQHHPEIGQSRRHRVTHHPVDPRQQHDRRGGRRQHRRRRIRNRHDRAGGVEVGGHHRKGFGGPVLPDSQAIDDVGVVGTAGEVEAADTFDRDHPPGQQCRARRADRIPGLVGGQECRDPGIRRARPRQPWPAVGAGDGLCVVAPVGRVGVLGGAGLAHREAGHRRGRSVVRQVGDDGVTGAAVGAGDERVAVAPVSRVAHLAQTVGAGGDVRRHQGAGAVVVVAADDLEATGVEGFNRMDVQGVDARHRRRAVAHGAYRSLDIAGRPLQFAVHRTGVVVDPAGQSELCGDPRDGGAEPHPLHHAGDVEVNPNGHVRQAS